MAANEKEIKLIISAYEKGIEATMNKVRKGLDGAEKNQSKLNKAMQSGEGRTSSLLRAMQSGNKTTRSFSDGMGGLHGRLEAVNRAGMALMRVLGPLAGTLAVREILDSAIGWERYEKALISVMGTQERANQELDWLREVSDRLGLQIETVAGSYTKLAAASKGTVLEGQATRDVFEAVAGAMSKLGASASDTDGALIALGQMISKGKVSAEELRQQLGERMPGAFQAFANAAGVSTAELDAMLQRGEVGIDLLPRFAEELRKAYDIDDSRIETAAAAIARLQNATLDLKLAIADSGLLSAFVSSLNDIAAAIKDPGLIANFRLLGDTINSIGSEGQGFRSFVNSLVEGLKILGLGAQTVLVPIKLLGEVAAATFAAISLAIEGDFRGAMAVLQDSTPGDKFREDLERLEQAAANLGSSFRATGEEAAKGAEGIKKNEQAVVAQADALTETINKQTEAVTAMNKQGAAAASVADVVKMVTAAEKELGAARADLITKTDELNAVVVETGTAYRAALAAAGAMTEEERQSGDIIDDLAAKRKAYADAVKKLNDEIYKAARIALAIEEKEHKNALDRRLIELERHVALGVKTEELAALEKQRLEEAFQREVVRLRAAALEETKRLYGEDSDQYKSMVQDKIDAENELQQIINKNQIETLTKLNAGEKERAAAVRAANNEIAKSSEDLSTRQLKSEINKQEKLYEQQKMAADRAKQLHGSGSAEYQAAAAAMAQAEQNLIKLKQQLNNELQKQAARIQALHAAHQGIINNIEREVAAIDSYAEASAYAARAARNFASSRSSLAAAYNRYAMNLISRDKANEIQRTYGGFRTYNTGGPVPGSGNRDTVPAMLTPGEYVLRKSAVERIGLDALHRLNQGIGKLDLRGGRQYLNSGGAVQQSLGTITLTAGSASAPVSIPAGSAGQQLMDELRRLKMVTV